MRSRGPRAVARGVGNPGLVEPFSTKLTGVAVAASEAVGGGIVAAQRERVVDAEGASELDDLALAEMEQRRLDAHGRGTLDAAARGEVGHVLERLDVLGTAIGIARVVERVDADEDVGGAEYLRPGEAEGEEDRVARRDVGDGNALRDVRFGAILGDVDVGGERRTAEGA